MSLFKLIFQVTGLYRGVKVASGQNLYSHQLILDPSFTIPPVSHSAPTDYPIERLQTLSQREFNKMVARGICVTTSSIKPDVPNCLVVYPPRCKTNVLLDFVERNK